MERLEDFTGTWSLRRVVVHADGGRSRVLGTAVFRSDPQGLRYSESGQMRHVPTRGRQVILSVQQRYLWSPGPCRSGADGIAVRFDDGRPFHDLTLGGQTSEAVHDCAPDRYVLHHDFAAWPDWQVICRVTGPRKDYTMRTRYRRIAATPES